MSELPVFVDGSFDDDDPDAPPSALGVVIEQDRGSLPYALIHGEALVACAAWALGEAGVHAVDLGTEWTGLVDAAEPVVLHDPLCPMTPADFIARCVALAAATDQVVVAVRPVTDTVKRLEDGRVGGGVDRARLHVVVSPVVLPASVVAALERLPDHDLPTLVAALAARFPIELVEAPPQARRVRDLDDLAVLQALTAPR